MGWEASKKSVFDAHAERAEPDRDLETESLFPSGGCRHPEGVGQSRCEGGDCYGSLAMRIS